MMTPEVKRLHLDHESDAASRRMRFVVRDALALRVPNSFTPSIQSPAPHRRDSVDRFVSYVDSGFGGYGNGFDDVDVGGKFWGFDERQRRIDDTRPLVDVWIRRLALSGALW